MKTDEELFYQHFLQKELERRQEAILFLENRDFNLLRNTHYCNTERKEVEILETELTALSKRLLEIAEQLPKNSAEANLFTFSNENDEIETWVQWKEYSIPPESKCESLARTWTRDALWKIKYQPNGKDAERRSTLLNKLKENLNV